MITLPQIAAEMSANAHALRTFLRRHRRDLRALGKPVGPTIVYDERAAALIREAFEKRRRLTLATTDDGGDVMETETHAAPTACVS